MTMQHPRLSRGLTALATVTVALAGVCPPASAQVQTARTVLTIHWGPETFPGTPELDAAIRDTLQTHADPPVNYFAEYLESEQFPPETASIALRDYIQKKFQGRRIDLVTANASGALQFALRFRDELFPGAPVVFSAATVPREVLDHTSQGITGVRLDLAFGDTVKMALTLHPSVKRLFVIAHSPAADGYDEQVQSALQRFADRVELVYMKERTLPELLAAVKAIPTQSLIFYTRYIPLAPYSPVDRDMYPYEIGRLIAEVAPVPIYASNERSIGTGVVGGMIRATDTIGTHVGEMARQILKGTPPEDIPIGTVPTTPIFDWRQVKRWGIDPSKLPPGSQILFRTPSVWETYRWYIIGTIVVVTAQLLLIAGLLRQRAGRRHAEETILAREASLRTSFEQSRQLAGRLINAQETIRASLARDLHDDICQRLATVSMDVDALRTSAGDIRDAVTQRAFDELARDTNNTLEGIRRLSHDLHPSTLPMLGLAPALRAHCAEIAKRHNVVVEFTTEGDLELLHPDIAVCLFRIAQESLRNGIAHAGAQRFRVSLASAGDDVVLTVTDDGRGFDLEGVRQNGKGLGLVSMEERVRVVGGEVEIVTRPQQGTTIRVRVPDECPQAAGA
jgi:signal transduction histidine kinase